MPRSRHCAQRTASPTSTAQVPRVLQRHPPASVPPQRQPPSTQGANPSWRAHRGDPAGRRPSSPLSARRLRAAEIHQWPVEGRRLVRFDLPRPTVFLTQPLSHGSPAHPLLHPLIPDCSQRHLGCAYGVCDRDTVADHEIRKLRRQAHRASDATPSSLSNVCASESRAAPWYLVAIAFLQRATSSATWASSRRSACSLRTACT
jgi:hypothetical protein